MATWETIKTRLSSESPEFFKKLKTVALWLGGSTAAVLTAIATFSLIVPPVITTICTYIIIGAAFTAGTAQFTVKDTAVLDKPAQ